MSDTTAFIGRCEVNFVSTRTQKTQVAGKQKIGADTATARTCITDVVDCQRGCQVFPVIIIHASCLFSVVSDDMILVIKRESGALGRASSPFAFTFTEGHESATKVRLCRKWRLCIRKLKQSGAKV